MAARANRRRPRTASAKVKVAFGNDDDNENGNATTPEYLADQSSPFKIRQSDRSPPESNYHQAFFTIHNTTVEVVLDNDLLSWNTVTNESHSKTSQNSSVNRVDMHDVYAISPINAHWNWSLNVTENVVGTNVSTIDTITSTDTSPTTLSQMGVLRGFQLHSYQTAYDNVLQEILIIFQSDNTDLLERWFHLLAKVISRYKPARHIFVLLNPYSGGKHTRHTYTTKIKTILERLPYKISYTEISDDYSADDAIQNFEDDFDSIDSLVILGGDGSVINVINALIRHLAKENRTRLDMENDLPTIPFPLCIIPEGTTNIIAHTIQGNIDHCTPLFHLIFNQTMKIDMSAIFDQHSNFITGNFSAGTGYPATVLKYFPRYSLHSPKTLLKKSFSKAASNKNLQSVEVEIRYIPATQNDVSIGRCCRGCPSCTPADEEKSDDQVKAFDDSHVQKLSRLRKSSYQDTNGRSFSGKQEKNWKILHDEYLQVAVLTNANLWTYAPQGLAKFGHLADGLLDLILIQPVTRKEFLRYVKRNGNSKNQFDLPFTKLIKVKEIEIELKSIDSFFSQISNNTDNQSQSSPSDDSSNENMSDNESVGPNTQKHQPHPPSAPMSEDTLRNPQRRRRINQTTQEHVLQPSKSMDATILHFKAKPQAETTSEIYGSTTSLRRSGGLFQSIKNQKNKFRLPRALSARGRETDEEKQARKSQRSSGTSLRPARSLLSLLSNGKADKTLTRSSESPGISRQPSVLSRSSSFTDNRKTTSSSRTKRPCMWNLDFSPYNSPVIRIKCFYRYLTVYGVGVLADTRIKEMNYSCFGRMG